MHKGNLIAVVATAFALILAVAGADPGPAQGKKTDKAGPAAEAAQSMSLRGEDLFQYYCASCHGTDGRGHGPVAKELKKPVPDLTLINKRHGGRFPQKRVENIIAGMELSGTAHGTREMPIWGPVFGQIEWDRDMGQVRLNNLARYLETIQQKF
jgi:mono/diheme cytochrome c family protein